MSTDKFLNKTYTPSERLKIAREALKINGAELSRTLGIGTSALSKLEKGNQSLKQEILISISDATKINLHWLLTGEGSMFLGEGDGSGTPTSSFTGKTCAECGQEYGLDKLVKEKDERLETQKDQIQLLKKENQRLEGENEVLKHQSSLLDRLEKKVG